MKQKHKDWMHAVSGLESGDRMTSRGGSDAGRGTAFSLPIGTSSTRPLLFEFRFGCGGARLELMLRREFDLEKPKSSGGSARGTGKLKIAAEPSLSIDCSASGISVGWGPLWDWREAVSVPVADRLRYLRASVGFFSRCRSCSLLTLDSMVIGLCSSGSHSEGGIVMLSIE